MSEVKNQVEPVNTNDLRDYAGRIGNPYAQFVIDAANELDDTRTERNILRAELAAAREELREVAEIKAAAKKVGLELRFPREKEGTYQVYWSGSFEDWAALATALKEKP
jgi:hypothetical protein